MSSSPRLFSPIQVGGLTLQHRVVMAPLTRFRAPNHIQTDMAVEYYTQRASTPGTLIISEATFIAEKAAGYEGAPGTWNDAQITAWRKITDAVHAKGSFMYLQLWALGRVADPGMLKAKGLPFVGAGDIPYLPLEADRLPTPPGAGTGDNEAVPVLRQLTVPEIKEYVQLYATAAKNAVEKAGFDGVEIHGTNGYLVDQFFQTNTNNRTDEYGGSVENRIRFATEVVDAVVGAVGAERTAIRLGPWSLFQGMGMQDPIPTFGAFVTWLREHHDKFAYIHVIEPRVSGNDEREHKIHESNQFIHDIWAPRPLMLVGGFGRDAIARAEEGNLLIAFGRHFIANPDLPLRLKNGLEFNPYNRATFYSQGPAGYIDYPFAK